MRSRNFNYIGDDLVKEWESSYLKNNPQTKRGGSRNLEEIWEKEVFPKSNEMINKLEQDCKGYFLGTLISIKSMKRVLHITWGIIFFDVRLNLFYFLSKNVLYKGR